MIINSRADCSKSSSLAMASVVGGTFSHPSHSPHLPRFDLLRPGDLLVMNNTRGYQLYGYKPSGALVGVAVGRAAK